MRRKKKKVGDEEEEGGKALAEVKWKNLPSASECCAVGCPDCSGESDAGPVPLPVARLRSRVYFSFYVTVVIVLALDRRYEGLYGFVACLYYLDHSLDMMVVPSRYQIFVL